MKIDSDNRNLDLNFSIRTKHNESYSKNDQLQLDKINELEIEELFVTEMENQIKPEETSLKKNKKKISNIKRVDFHKSVKEASEISIFLN